MRYYVTLEAGAAPIEVALRELPSGELEAHVGGVPVDLDVAGVPGGLSVRVDGHVVDLTLEGAAPEVGVVASGHRSYMRVESERMRAALAAAAHKPSAGEEILRAPMPGRVVRVLVAPGDDVVAGQGLVVVEAMKMENELRAKVPGRVAEVLVTAGAAVEGNAKLLRFARPPRA